MRYQFLAPCLLPVVVRLVPAASIGVGLPGAGALRHWARSPVRQCALPRGPCPVAPWLTRCQSQRRAHHGQDESSHVGLPIAHGWGLSDRGTRDAGFWTACCVWSVSVGVCLSVPAVWRKGTSGQPPPLRGPVVRTGRVSECTCGMAEASGLACGFFPALQLRRKKIHPHLSPLQVDPFLHSDWAMHLSVRRLRCGEPGPVPRT